MLLTLLACTPTTVSTADTECASDADVDTDTDSDSDTDTDTDADTDADAWACPEDLPSDDAFEGYAPVVTCTVPRVGDAEVDPALTELRATFSKDMRDGSWSWVQISDRSFPETTGDAYFDTDRTNVLPVALQPGHTYVVWLNYEPYTSFEDRDGNAAVPFQWTFRTAAD